MATLRAVLSNGHRYVRADSGWRCERCGHRQEPGTVFFHPSPTCPTALVQRGWEMIRTATSRLLGIRDDG